jgi:hypothetical protein
VKDLEREKYEEKVINFVSFLPKKGNALKPN